MTDDQLGQIVRKVFQEYGISSPITSWDDLSERRKAPHIAAGKAVIAATDAERADQVRDAVDALIQAVRDWEWSRCENPSGMHFERAERVDYSRHALLTLVGALEAK